MHEASGQGNIPLTTFEPSTPQLDSLFASIGLEFAFITLQTSKGTSDGIFIRIWAQMKPEN
jgi:hypothetical protein